MSVSRKPHRLLPWIICAVILSVLLVLVNMNNISQILGKLLAPCAGGVIASLLYEKLALPYFRPSGYLAQEWHLEMVFKPGVADHEIVPGTENRFMLACTLKAAFIIAGMIAVGLGN